MESMEYYALIGIIVVFVGGFLAAVAKWLHGYKKAVEEDVEKRNKSADELTKALYEVKDEVTKLTAKVEAYFEKLTVQENRVTKHGMEIDAIKKEVTAIQTKLGNLEFKVEQYHGDKV